MTTYGRQAKNIIFVFLVFTIVSSLSAASFVTGNAFAKKSSSSGGGDSGNKDKGGGGSSKDKGGSGGGGSSGGTSDNGGGGGSSSDKGGGGTMTGGTDNSNGGSTNTPSTTEETTNPPPATEGSTTSSPPPTTAENQQTTPCAGGSTPDENGKCPSTTSPEQQNTAAPPAAAGEQSPCAGGATPDPTTGDCSPPPTTTALAPSTSGGSTTTTPTSTQGALDLQVPNADGNCPTGYHLINTNVCAKDAGTPASGGSGTGGSSTGGTTTGATQPGNTGTGTTTPATTQGGHILVMSNPDGSCPAGSHKFPGSQVCEKDAATTPSSSGGGGQVPPECQGIIAGPSDKCSLGTTGSPTSINGAPQTITQQPPQPTPLGDGSFQLPTVPPVPNTNTIAPICPSGSHLELSKCVVDGVQCPSGTVQDGDKCSPSSAAAAGSQTQQVCGPNSASTVCAAAKAASGCPADATLSNGNCFKQTEVPANPDGRCPEGAYSVGSSGNAGQPGTGSIICLKNVPVKATPPPATPPTNTPPAEPSQPKQLAQLAATATPTALHVNSDGTLNTDANQDGSCPQGSDHTSDPKQCKVISMQANQDGTCPVHTSHFQGTDAKQCFVDTALQTANTGVSTGTTPMLETTTTPVTCKTGEHLDTSSSKCMPDFAQLNLIDHKCPEDYHFEAGTDCLSNFFALPDFDGGGCAQGWHVTDASKNRCARDTTPSTQISYTYVDVGQPLASGTCDKGTKIGDRCLLGAMDIGGVVLGKCSSGDKIGNRCVIIPTQVIPIPKVLGHCPAGYHVLEAGVSCAFDINMQASTPATTQTGGTGTGTTTTTPATTQTGNAKGTTTGTTTNTGGPTNTPGTTQQTGGTNNGAGGGTTTTTTSPTSTTSTTTSTTSVINRGGSSSGGGGGTASGGSGGGGTGTAAPSQGANNFLTYVNAINKITIKYPSTWTKTDLVGNPRIPVMFSAPTLATATTTPASTAAKTSFVISITPSASSLDSFTQQQLNTLTQSKAIKYTITDTNAKVLTPPNGITAFSEVSYDAVKNNNAIPTPIPLKGAAIFFVNGNTGYSLLYLAKQTDYTQNIPMVQQMVNSFQVGGNSASASGSSAGVQNVAAAAGSSQR